MTTSAAAHLPLQTATRNALGESSVPMDVRHLRKRPVDVVHRNDSTEQFCRALMDLHRRGQVCRSRTGQRPEWVVADRHSRDEGDGLT